MQQARLLTGAQCGARAMSVGQKVWGANSDCHPCMRLCGCQRLRLVEPVSVMAASDLAKTQTRTRKMPRREKETRYCLKRAQVMHPEMLDRARRLIAPGAILRTSLLSAERRFMRCCTLPPPRFIAYLHSSLLSNLSHLPLYSFCYLLLPNQLSHLPLCDFCRHLSRCCCGHGPRPVFPT